MRNAGLHEIIAAFLKEKEQREVLNMGRVFTLIILIMNISFISADTIEERLEKLEKEAKKLKREVKSLKDKNSILELIVVKFSKQYDFVKFSSNEVVRLKHSKKIKGKLDETEVIFKGDNVTKIAPLKIRENKFPQIFQKVTMLQLWSNNKGIECVINFKPKIKDPILIFKSDIATKIEIITKNETLSPVVQGLSSCSVLGEYESLKIVSDISIWMQVAGQNSPLFFIDFDSISLKELVNICKVNKLIDEEVLAEIEKDVINNKMKINTIKRLLQSK